MNKEKISFPYTHGEGRPELEEYHPEDYQHLKFKVLGKTVYMVRVPVSWGKDENDQPINEDGTPDTEPEYRDMIVTEDGKMLVKPRYESGIDLDEERFLLVGSFFSTNLADEYMIFSLVDDELVVKEMPLYEVSDEYPHSYECEGKTEGVVWEEGRPPETKKA